MFSRNSVKKWNLLRALKGPLMTRNIVVSDMGFMIQLVLILHPAYFRSMSRNKKVIFFKPLHPISIK